MQFFGKELEWPFKSKGLVYRKPVLAPIMLPTGDQSLSVGAHFDLASNDPFSVTTGRVYTPQELILSIAGYAADKTSLPEGMTQKQLIKAYKAISPTRSALGFGQVNITRLPLWEGNPQVGPWDAEDKVGNDISAAGQPDAAKEQAGDDDQPSIEVEESKPASGNHEFVKVTEVIDGRPMERLAVRLTVPWTGELQALAKKNNNIYITETLEFLTERAQVLEARGDKVAMSSEKLIALTCSLATEEAKVAGGKKPMGRFDSVPGIYRVYNTPKADQPAPPQ